MVKISVQITDINYYLKWISQYSPLVPYIFEYEILPELVVLLFKIHIKKLVIHDIL